MIPADESSQVKCSLETKCTARHDARDDDFSFRNDDSFAPTSSSDYLCHRRFIFFSIFIIQQWRGSFEVLHTLVSSRKIRQQQERKRKWSKLSNWKFVKRTARVSEDWPGAVPLGHGEITFPLIVGRVYVLFLQLHQRFFRLKCHRSHPLVSLNWRSSI